MSRIFTVIAMRESNLFALLQDSTNESLSFSTLRLERRENSGFCSVYFYSPRYLCLMTASVPFDRFRWLDHTHENMDGKEFLAFGSGVRSCYGMGVY